MRLLLDTHIFIWWNANLELLSPAVRSLCENQENTLVLSLASIWEMQIKSQLGKLTFNQRLSEIIESQQRANGLELLPITTTLTTEPRSMKAFAAARPMPNASNSRYPQSYRGYHERCPL